MLIRLADIAHARSADKADWVDFGLFAWNPAGYTVLARVDCWPLPNLLAIKLVLHDALQGGSARNLRLDNLGKSMGAALLRMRVELSDTDWAQCQAAPRVGWWPPVSG